MISDRSVQELYSRAYAALPAAKRDPQFRVAQFFRGVTSRRWKNNPHPASCRLYISVFKQYQIIPEYCFSCFKVLVVPRTVVELFKLMILFDRVKYPGNNSRKCMIERRPGISGLYKGYVYCQSLEEAMDLLDITRNLVASEISEEIPVNLRRGCSEYPAAYPEYSNIGENGELLMAYPEEWRETENAAVDMASKIISPMMHDTYDHAGFDENDTLAMCAWIAYAAAIGDSSYLKITPLSAAKPMPNINRSFRGS